MLGSCRHISSFNTNYSSVVVNVIDAKQIILTMTKYLQASLRERNALYIWCIHVLTTKVSITQSVNSVSFLVC